MKQRPVVQPRTDVSCKARAVHTFARTLVRPFMMSIPLSTWTMPLFGLLESAAARRRPPAWARTEPVGFDGFAAEWVRAAPAAGSAPGALDKARDGAVVLYFHGGAFLFCGLATHRPAIAAISRASGVPALSVAYRQLPEVSLNGSVEDCLTAYRWLLGRGYAPENVVFAGDSAGGYLAYATALRAAGEGLAVPAGIVAISPWLDLDCESKLNHPNSRRDAYAPVKRLPRLVSLLTEGVVPADPLLSPVNHDLSVLPPSLLIAAEHEMLRCDSELMAERLAAAGVPCTLQIWEGQVHAFPMMVGLVPEAARAIREVGSFVRRRVGAELVAARQAS